MIGAAGALTLAAAAASANAACDSGEVVVKLSHVTGGMTNEVVAANNFAERVNSELNGRMCMEVYPTTRSATQKSWKLCC